MVSNLLLFLLLLSTPNSSAVSETVAVAPVFPAKIEQYQEEVVRFKIVSSNVSNYAKLNLRFSEEIEVVPVDLSGASFFYDKKQLKLTWLNLAQQGEIEIRLKIRPMTKSVHLFEGEFIYVEKLLESGNDVLINRVVINESTFEVI
jgi:hypothetical protein